MKLLHVALEYPPAAGGGGTYVQTLAHALGEEPDTDVFVITSGEHNITNVEERVTVLRRASFLQALQRIHLSAALINDTLEAVHELQPDVVHAHHTIPILALQALSCCCRVPTVYTQHRTPETPSSDVKADGKGLLAELAYAMGRDKAWIAPSGFFRQRLIRSGIPATHINVIYPSISRHIFQPFPQAEAKQRVYNQFGLDKALPLFTIPVVDRPRKDLDLGLRAIAQSGQICQVLITGLHCSSERYRALEAQYPKLRLVAHDFIPYTNLPIILSASDGVIIPSAREGFGIAALEALASGSRVYIRKAPGLDEITALQPDAIAFQSDDELTVLLTQTFAHPRPHDQAVAQAQQVYDCFAPAQRAQAHLNTYRHIASMAFNVDGISFNEK